MNLTQPLISYSDLMSQDLAPIVWEVEPLIARGDRVVVFGEFGAFKSWILLSLSLHLGAGKRWLDTFQIHESRRVLYVDEEMNERTLRRRGKRLGMGASIPSAPGLAFLSRAGVRFDGVGASTLLAYLKGQKFLPDVIVVEALRRVLVGDENEARDMAQFWRNLEPISRLGISLILSHHMTKPPMQGKRSIRYRASGSTDILAGSDASFAVERVAVDIARISGTKSRDDVELQPFLVKLSDNGDRQGPVTLTPCENTGSRSEPLSPDEETDVFKRKLGASRGSGVAG